MGTWIAARTAAERRLEVATEGEAIERLMASHDLLARPPPTKHRVSEQLSLRLGD